MILSVSYDLHNPGRDYEDIISTIKSAASFTHPQGSLWLIDTTLSPEAWVGRLRAAGDPNDEYLVTQLSHNWWSSNLDNDSIAWLKNPSRSW